MYVCTVCNLVNYGLVCCKWHESSGEYTNVSRALCPIVLSYCHKLLFQFLTSLLESLLPPASKVQSCI